MAAITNETIVIVGFGWVGQANALALLRLGYDVAFYDVVQPKFHYSNKYYELYEKFKSLPSLLAADSDNTWYIVCIGDRVSIDGVQDISLIKNTLNQLQSAKGKVILRSTVLPHYLAAMPFNLYLPEFLHEINAVEECFNPYYFVVGRRDNIELPSFLKQWQERAYKVFFGTPEEASYIKYLSNIWNAARIAITNEFGDSITLPSSSGERKRIEHILDFIFEQKSYLRYGKSFSGHCLPKDLCAYIDLKRKDHPVPLLEGIAAANTAHARIEEQYQTLPQWFSTWEYQGARGIKGFVRKFWDAVNRWQWVRIVRHAVKPLILRLEHLVPRQNLLKAKQQWNTRAKINPFYYAYSDAPSGNKIDEYEFKQSGEEDFKKYLVGDKFLMNQLGTLSGKVVLEIGTGIGRILEPLSLVAQEAHSIDISPVMLEIARRRLVARPNIILKENIGNDIPYHDDTFDFIFSQHVFKHFGSSIVIVEYFKEIFRTLKSDGFAKIQLRTGPAVRRWRWFYGVSLTSEEITALLEQAHLQIVRSEQENAKSLWVTVRKDM